MARQHEEASDCAERVRFLYDGAERAGSRGKGFRGRLVSDRRQEALDQLHKGGTVHIQHHEGVLFGKLEVAPEIRDHLAEGVCAAGLHVDAGFLAGEELGVGQVQQRAHIVEAEARHALLQVELEVPGGSLAKEAAGGAAAVCDDGHDVQWYNSDALALKHMAGILDMAAARQLMQEEYYGGDREEDYD